MTGSFESDVVGPPPPMVREETPQDRDSIAELLRSAFGRDTEGDAVEGLREVGGPRARGLVAVRSERRPGADMSAVGIGDVVGYARLTPVSVGAGEDTVMVLAPLAIAESSRRTGVGTYLVQFAMEIMGDAGYSAVVTPYDEPFLDRFGFAAAGESELSVQGRRPLRVAALRPAHASGEVRLPEPLAALV
jgi:predicted N-acetyltransferase YhbS